MQQHAPLLAVLTLTIAFAGCDWTTDVESIALQDALLEDTAVNPGDTTSNDIGVDTVTEDGGQPDGTVDMVADMGPLCGGLVCGDAESCCDEAGTQVCADTATSTTHCGACGNSCAVNEICVDGGCTCGVDPGGANAACDAASEECCDVNSTGNSDEFACVPAGTCDCGGNTCAAGNACCDVLGTDTCIDPQADIQHCGGCNQACPDAAQTCDTGSCVCHMGTFGCENNTLCADVFTDPNHCGSCGMACAMGETCCGGQCVDTDTSVTHCGGCNQACSGNSCTGGQCGCDGTPTDLSTDPEHCGSCAISCLRPNATTACVSGNCDFATSMCDADRADCDMNVGFNGCEVDTSTDNQNCGTCGTVCGSSSACLTGTCTCDANRGDCDMDMAMTGCEVDLLTDDLNCGACGNVCGAASTCQMGACVCDAGLTDCNGDGTGNDADGCEADFQIDTSNCGMCGTQCGGASDCTAGVCGCDAGTADCDGGGNGTDMNGCETATDADPNCGLCNVVCSTDSSCTMGACLCAAGTADCNGDGTGSGLVSTPGDGCEIDILNDDDNCGACGNVCGDASSCQMGVCVCEGNMQDCDGTGGGNDMNGCESSRLADINNCGSCGTSCVRPSSTVLCAMGTCDFAGATCAQDTDDCNMDIDTDGCEVDLTSDPVNCGTCATVCGGSSTCQSSACVCDNGTGDCNGTGDGSDSDGCETFIINNETHCGACGNSCARPSANVSCSGTTCDFANATCVGTSLDCNMDIDADGCEDQSTDASSCVACGNVCGTASTCGPLGCVCDTDLGDCNGDGTGNDGDGCEQDLLTDVNHCGACMNACPPDHLCQAGACSAKIVQVGTGDDFTCARSAANEVFCWGRGGEGRLGLGLVNIDFATPQLLVGVTAVDLSVGRHHACIIDDMGDVLCWGRGDERQLGDNSTGDNDVPTPTTAMPDVAVDVSAGYSNTCAVLANGDVYCWGSGSDGEIGENDDTSRDEPTQVDNLSNATQVSVGDRFACALNNGVVYCWGRGDNGRIGDNDWSDRWTPRRVELNGGANLGAMVMVDVGERTGYALHSSGTVYAWGDGGFGQLGDGGTSDIGYAKVGNLWPTMAVIDGGEDYACGITPGGAMYCAGDVKSERLGNTSASDPSDPIQVTGLDSDVFAIGVNVAHEHTCAVLASTGGVKCWGRNDMGQIGNGTVVNPQATPDDVSDLP